MSLFSLFEEERAEGPFTILTVCTGNICRSPLSEVMLRKGLHGLPAIVHSAGTQALVDHGMTTENQDIAAELGLDGFGGHRARQITEQFIREADLVLALSREHRSAIVELVPRASRKVFTLREFARLARAVTRGELGASESELAEGRMRDAVEVVAQLRGTVPAPEDPLELDVIDPYKQSDEIYVRSAGEITPAVNSIVQLFRAAVSGWSDYGAGSSSSGDSGESGGKA
ncbi:low molecular weight phosphatase family protein [Leucobacter denitrificans]|uniref:Low molecular weight phosphatase family protein n=1 Tax=Leucobacter denitrificans TaxID=683042 RepID=A0A7G9S7A7_9MICO|nr:low molecular weight phosphatase family protein [Leucobacter denitrificans]QNN63732.1 low molecular weight phosphatase family protein [Leucobacter denitrificans]